MKKFLALLLAVSLTASLVACGSKKEEPAPAAESAPTEQAPAEQTPAAPEYTITLGHIQNENDSWHLAALDFKEQVETNSNGRIKVEVYPNSQLGSEVDMIQSILQQGGCDITYTGESMQTYQPDLGMIGMPYLIQSDEQMERVLTGEPGARFEQLMEDAGMKVLGYFVRGPRYITSNREIHSVADCKNLVIRTPQSPMTVAAFEAIGAKPTPMALNEVFQALDSGTIEAQENPYAFIQNQSFYEVCKYLIETAHLRAWVYIAMGKAQFDALPEDLQKVVTDAGKHAQDCEHELFLENEAKFAQQLQDEGMTFIEVDTKEFADTMISGVLPTLTDSQKALYDAIDALK